MRILRLKLNVVKLVTKRDVKRSKQAVPTKETERKSITSATIEPEVWIMSALLLSLVQQIVGASLQQRPGAEQETHKKEHND